MAKKKTYIIISKEVIADEPFQLLSNPAGGVHDVTVALCQGPNLPQVQPTLVVPAAQHSTSLLILK